MIAKQGLPQFSAAAGLAAALILPLATQAPVLKISFPCRSGLGRVPDYQQEKQCRKGSGKLDPKEHLSIPNKGQISLVGL